MSETKQISPDRMQQYFDGFSRRFLQKDSVATVDVEPVSPPAATSVFPIAAPATCARAMFMLGPFVQLLVAGS